MISQNTETSLKAKVYAFGFHDKDGSVFRTPMGLNKGIVESISHYKKEPEWMRKFRLSSLTTFEQKPLPYWGADLSDLNFNNIHYYVNPSDRKYTDWSDVPEEIRDTYDKIGIPEAEKRFLAGVGAQYDSEVIYHNLKIEWEKKGVIFLGMDEGLKKYPDLVKRYFGTVIPPSDNKFSALNSAVWSGGSFIYIPPGVQVTIPLQAYFRINAVKFEITTPRSEVKPISGTTNVERRRRAPNQRLFEKKICP